MAKFKTPQQAASGGGSRRSQAVSVARPNLPDIIEPRCKICTHPQRREIDMMLALGWSQSAVISHWNQIMKLQDLPEDEWFKKTSMSTHSRKHLAIHDAGVRRILEDRARAEGIDIDLVEGFIRSKTGVAEALIGAGLESLHRGHTTVEPKDILIAIKTLAELEENRAALAEEQMLRDIKAFTTAVKRVVPEEMWEDIYDTYEAELGKVNLAISPPDVEQDIIVDAEEILEDEDQLRLFEEEDYGRS